MSSSWASRVRARALDLFRRLRDEHASPRQIACAIGVGVFCGCTPAVGFHGALAVGCAVALRLNKLWTWLGSRSSNVVILPWIVLAEIQLAHRVRTGAWAPLTAEEALDHGRELLLDWILGCIPVGLALGALGAAIAYVIARTRARRRPPTSGSPA